MSVPEDTPLRGLQGRRMGRVVPKDLSETLVNLQQPGGSVTAQSDRPLRLGQMLANQQGSQVQVRLLPSQPDMADRDAARRRRTGSFAQAKTSRRNTSGTCSVAEVRLRELLAGLSHPGPDPGCAVFRVRRRGSPPLFAGQQGARPPRVARQASKSSS